MVVSSLDLLLLVGDSLRSAAHSISRRQLLVLLELAQHLARVVEVDIELLAQLLERLTTSLRALLRLRQLVVPR